MAKQEFELAFNEVLDSKQLPKEIVLEAIQAAMVSAYRKTVNASSAQHVEARLDAETGAISIHAEKEVVEEVQDDRTEVTLEDARLVDPAAELGQIVVVPSTPADFGRVAAQTARQVIQQRIREAERQAQFDYFHNLQGEVVNGVVQAVNPGFITLGLDRNAEASMPRNQQIRGERFRVHDRVRALLLEVKLEPRGPKIILSRAHRNFLRRLLEEEVPEIYHGLVEIRSIAREPGYRSKVAVAALQPGIDPVGACVGIRGVRIQAIVRELNDEKIDVIEWNPDQAAYIAKALSPARVSGVYLDETGGGRTATVIVPEDQLSLAIGKDGQNARLGAKLTGWRIDIKSLSEAASEALGKLGGEEFAEQHAALAESMPQVESILAKKAEGRPITPEEYSLLGRFVNQVETGAADRRQAEVEVERARQAELRARIPATAFDIPLDDLGLSPRLNILITGEGYSTIGDLMMQMEVDRDAVLALNGVGPKAMEEIDAKLAAFVFPEPQPEPEPEEPAAPEAEPLAEGEPAAAAAAAEPESQAGETPAPISIEEAFAAVLAAPADATTDEEETPISAVSDDKAKKGKKKKKAPELEYDPDKDVTIVRKRHKKGTGEWTEWDEEV
ncbi:MAG: transcription termination/antitermination protein NusA [Chloroflexi bacterium]|nr:transcription termination/antitermination protein NusA [Chloroflexota bacterium]